jgi:drug/metabolite transporter (DMT)-like permease
MTSGVTNLRVELPDRLTLLAFGGAVVIAGANIVAVRFTIDDVAPFFGAGFRFGIAGLMLLVVAAFRKVPVPRGRELVGTVLYGLLAFGGAMALGYWALQELPAAVGGVVIASVPVLTLFLARIQGLEPFRWRGLFGGLLTMVGIWVLVSGSGTGAVPLGSAFAMLGGAVCLAEAGIVAKKFPPCHPMVFNGLAMAAGASVLLGASQLAGESWSLPTDSAVWLALAYMVLLGSIALFALYLFVLEGWSASAASYQFVLIPFVTALLGAWLLGEAVDERFAVGGLIVLAGVYVGALTSRKVLVPSHPHQEAHAQRCSTT